MFFTLVKTLLDKKSAKRSLMMVKSKKNPNLLDKNSTKRFLTVKSKEVSSIPKLLSQHFNYRQLLCNPICCNRIAKIQESNVFYSESELAGSVRNELIDYSANPKQKSSGTKTNPRTDGTRSSLRRLRTSLNFSFLLISRLPTSLQCLITRFLSSLQRKTLLLLKKLSSKNLSPKLSKLLMWKKMSNKGKTLSKKMLQI